MTDTVPETVPKRADQLVVGDKLLPKFMPYTRKGSPGEIIFLKAHHVRREDWVFVAFQRDDGLVDSTTFRADGVVDVFPADTGLAYSRGDDGETTQPIAGRVPAHFGAVEASGLIEVDEPEAQR